MRRDKTPELQAHPGEPARHADNSHQQAIEGHHINGAKTSRDPEGKGREAHAHVIGHDGAGGQWLDSHDGVRPHLMAVDRLHHLGAQNLHLEVRILISQDGANHTGDREDQNRHQAMLQVPPES